MFLHTKLFPVKLSGIVFIVIPSITKQINSFTFVLFVTLFGGHKIDKILIIMVQTMVNLESISSHYATKYRHYHILRNFPLQWKKLTPKQITAKLLCTSKWDYRTWWKSFPNFFIHIKEMHIVKNNFAYTVKNRWLVTANGTPFSPFLFCRLAEKNLTFFISLSMSFSGYFLFRNHDLISRQWS